MRQRNRKSGPPARDGGGAIDAVLPGDLVRALGWLRQRLDEPVHLDVLAQVAGVRPRTLETHFRTFLGTTPLGWVRKMRLHNARRSLLASRDQSVTDAALANGFSQLGRFAAHYRAEFGELPSKTLQRVRAAEPEVDDEALRLTWRALSAALHVAPRDCEAALEELDQAQNAGAQIWTGEGTCRLVLGPARGAALQRHAGSRSCPGSAPRPRSGGSRTRQCPGTDLVQWRARPGASSRSADRLIERALAIDPYSPLAIHRRAWLSAYQGNSAAAMRGLRMLMPFDALRHTAFIGMGCAHFAAGRYERAAIWAKSGVEAFPRAFLGERIVIAGAVHAGARAEARRRARALLRKDPI
jgi:AraC-like DNA-binding protein